MLRQPLVEKGVVRPQQIEHASIFAHDAVDEELGLQAKRLTEVVVEVRIQAHVRVDRRQVAQPEPLPGEVAREIVRARIGEHSADVPLEHVWPAELSANGRIEQRVIGQAAPEKKRQARCQLEIADAVGGARPPSCRDPPPRGTGIRD